MRAAAAEPLPGHVLATLGALPLEVDAAAVEVLERRTVEGTVRRSTLLRLCGRGEEGLGEDVTFQPADALAAAPAVPLAAISTLADLWRVLDHADLFDRPPRFDVVRSYRRWAIEAAALDLGLRQSGLTLPGVVGREPRPLRIVVSAAGVAVPAGVGRKVDLAELAPGLAVEVIDFKGGGTETDARRALTLYPDALQEDPPVALTGARVSWDVGIRSAADLDLLSRVPAAVNVKPARIGSFRGLVELYAACAERGIALYGGGQFELGPGRGQAQLLAALVHPDASNDLAPTEANLEPTAAAGVTSPLTIVADRGFRASC